MDRWTEGLCWKDCVLRKISSCSVKVFASPFHAFYKQTYSPYYRWSHDTPTSKEAYLYRELFEHHFPQPACTESVVRWIPRKDWGCNEDPSGRAQTVHNAAYQAKLKNGPKRENGVPIVAANGTKDEQPFAKKAKV